MISWGLSLVGRAPALHAGGQEFDSPSLHQIRSAQLLLRVVSEYMVVKIFLNYRT